MAFEKHRDEKETYELDFAQNRLVGAETLSSVTLAKVRKRTTTGWEDVTTEFGALGAVVASGTKVQFTLHPAASASVQLAGVYQVLIKALTSTTRDVVDTVALTVSARASI